MRRASTILLASLALLGFTACNGPSTAPTRADSSTATVSEVSGTPAPPAGVTTISFGGLSNGDAIASYFESGYTLTVDTGNWAGVTTYGNPAPSLQFKAAAGATVTAGVRITAGGVRFGLASLDVYSSTTPIPYAVTGLTKGAATFTFSGTVPNTFGKFRTVVNPYASADVDTVSIVLTNPAAPCCPNPMGVDTILLRR